MATEFQKFNSAMDAIIRADPKAVKAAVDAEIQANTAEREARGERKRGRKTTARLARIKFDSSEIEKQTQEFAELMSLVFPQGFQNFEPRKILELFLNLITIDGMPASYTSGSDEIIYRIRFTADFDRFCAALRTGNTFIAVHILEGLQEKQF